MRLPGTSSGVFLIKTPCCCKRDDSKVQVVNRDLSMAVIRWLIAEREAAPAAKVKRKHKPTLPNPTPFKVLICSAAFNAHASGTNTHVNSDGMPSGRFSNFTGARVSKQA